MPQTRRKPRPPDVCPVCGHDVPPTALSCPGCGADHNTGWRDEAAYDGLDLPDGEFDYDDFVKKEFGGAVKPRGIATVWWVVAIILLLVFAAYYLGLR